jgi:Glutamine amidotransferases class-II
MITSLRNGAKGAARNVVRNGRSGNNNKRTALVSSSRVAAATANSTSQRLMTRQAATLYYTTERIVELRSGKQRNNIPKTLYDAVHEKDNCGVGLIASLKSIPSRSVVEKADEMLVRMAHRGGCGCDPASGDGSGKWLFFKVHFVKLKVTTWFFISFLLTCDFFFYHLNL